MSENSPLLTRAIPAMGSNMDEKINSALNEKMNELAVKKYSFWSYVCSFAEYFLIMTLHRALNTQKYKDWQLAHEFYLDWVKNNKNIFKKLE